MRQIYLTRLRETPVARYMKMPYIKVAGLTEKRVDALFRKLVITKEPSEDVIRPLLMASLSEEIQAIALNMMDNISDEEAVKRAEQRIDSLLAETDEPREEKLAITNQDAFPDVDWLPPEDVKVVGTAGDDPIVLLGKEQGTEVPIVARSYTDNPLLEDLFAINLYELLSHSQDPVRLTEADDTEE